MSDIKLDIPDITVVVDKGDEYITQILPPAQYTVHVTQSGDTVAIVQQPAVAIVPTAESLLRFANFATSASYTDISNVALKVRILPGELETGEMVYSGSFSGNGSQLTEVVASTIPTAALDTPSIGHIYVDGGFLYIFDGVRYRSASLN